MTTVIGLEVEHGPGPVGDQRVVVEDGEERVLATVLGQRLGRRGPPHDQAHRGDLAALDAQGTFRSSIEGVQEISATPAPGRK